MGSKTIQIVEFGDTLETFDLKSYKLILYSKWYYSVIHISIPPIKELCSKIAPGEVGVSLP